MIMDAQTALLDKVAITSTGTTYSNSYDTGVTPGNLGRGRPIRAKITVDTTFTSGGSATLQVNYVQSANSDLSSPDILATGLAAAVATLIAGTYVVDYVIPDNTKRYVGFQIVVAVAAMTAGAATAALILESNSPLYPAAT